MLRRISNNSNSLKKIKESIERKIRLNVLFEQVRERSSRDRDREGKATSPKGKERDREAIEAERAAATEAEREAATEVEKTPDIRLEPEIKSDAKEAERLNKLIFSQLSKNCGHNHDYFNNIINSKGRADWYLDNKESKKHKICTHIGVPTLQINVDVSYKIKI
jgi:hypothetical protein